MATKMVARPRLFIGSSKESLSYAYAIQQNLEDDAEVTVWRQGIFKLTKTSLESLIKGLDRSDFAVFVFAPNDALRLRKQNYSAVRDNVTFELGLSIGKLGPHRTFIVVPKDSKNLRIPTDLAGITPGRFDPNRNDKNLEAAFGPFCSQVRGEIRHRGKKAIRSRAKPSSRPAKSDELVVLEARYGIQDRWIDVTKQLNAAIHDQLHILVTNEIAGRDPYQDVQKNIIVRYKYKNQELEKTAQETTYLDLP
jgi:CAP12/Pycsar effector protein, TIR domain